MSFKKVKKNKRKKFKDLVFLEGMYIRCQSFRLNHLMLRIDGVIVVLVKHYAPSCNITRFMLGCYHLSICSTAELQYSNFYVEVC